ncbi:MAG TPA: PDZ domain-containing protein [Thermoanaerobaculia bacterium]|nr:PDZ domain-containing protein [Thermoanaerobaculia bacterium]
MPAEPIRYTLTFPAPANHYVEVAASFPSDGAPWLDLMLPVWTPGSYKVRDYSRHLEGMAAEGPAGDPLTVIKTRKNHWRVETGGSPRVQLRYRVYGHELTVRTNFVDPGFALLNGAATFLTLQGPAPRPHEVDVVLPRGWREVHTSLDATAEGGPHRFVAADHDALVDAPIYAGSPAAYGFEVAGRPHLLVNEGEDGTWDGPRSAADVEKIVRQVVGFWGQAPYPRYLFLNLILEGRGGLEHAASTVLMTSRWQSRTRAGYLDWLGLVAHEFFHTWNVKRLRPLELGPFAYDEEVYTRGLWVAEGITSYYDDLLVHRAGLSRRDEYLRALSKTIRTLQTVPGRRVQTLEEASFDAWIKHYQPDENTVNSAISYYVKGAVAAFLLDTAIRRATAGARSLDDVMRLAYRRHSGERGFLGAEIEAAAAEVAGEDLARFFDRALRTTEELSYAEALQTLGLRFRHAAQKRDGDDQPEEPAGWLGADTRVADGRLVVREVRRATPAHDAGVDVDDEILAFDGYRVPPAGLAERLQAYRPGEAVSLLVARREKLLRLPLVLGEDPGEGWNLEVDPDATPEQQQRLAEWLAGSANIGAR